MFVYVGGESVYSSSKTLHSKVSPRGRRRGRGGGGEKVRQKTKIASAIIRTEQAGGGGGEQERCREETRRGRRSGCPRALRLPARAASGASEAAGGGAPGWVSALLYVPGRPAGRLRSLTGGVGWAAERGREARRGRRPWLGLLPPSLPARLSLTSETSSSSLPDPPPPPLLSTAAASLKSRAAAAAAPASPEVVADPAGPQGPASPKRRTARKPSGLGPAVEASTAAAAAAGVARGVTRSISSSPAGVGAAVPSVSIAR